MNSKFLIIATILIFLLLALVLTFGFKTINGMSSGANHSAFGFLQEVMFYWRKAVYSAIDLSTEIYWSLKSAAISISEAVKAFMH